MRGVLGGEPQQAQAGLIEHQAEGGGAASPVEIDVAHAGVGDQHALHLRGDDPQRVHVSPTDDGDAALARARLAAAAAYKAGRVSLIEVLDADSQLLSLRDARVQAQAEAARAAINGFKALGGGWVA